MLPNLYVFLWLVLSIVVSIGGWILVVAKIRAEETKQQPAKKASRGVLAWTTLILGLASSITSICILAQSS